jgi:LPXTG-site transpeptidase (sortase) family protein
MLLGVVVVPVVKVARFRPRVSALSALVLLCSLTIGSLASPQDASAAITNNYYVPSTGHTFSDPFLTQWAQLDGRDLLGLPVTEVLDGDESRTQYFEFGALTGPSDDEVRPIELELIQTGRELLSERHDPTRLVSGRRIGGQRETAAFTKRDEPSNEKVQFDSETGHQISGRILSYYKKHSGQEVFGRPISDAYDTAGKRVQWFEFGRLELGNEDEASPGAAGLDLAIARGLDVSKVKNRGLTDFDPDRFKRYFGDGTFPEAYGPFDPARIVIPAINVDAAIEQVGVIDGQMGTPEDVWAVGWYPIISEPGNFTNVVMAGHKDWWNVGPVVFWDLNLLVPGNKVYLTGDDGSGFTYIVTESFEIDANTNANVVASDTGGEMLTLITCGGPFDGVEYLQRWIVRAERI